MRRLVAFGATALCACRIGFDGANSDGTVMLGDILLPDGPTGSVTSSWGEDPNAQHRGVTADTFLSGKAETTEDERDENFGATTTLEIDDDKRPLIRFDLSAILPTATIVSASLRVTLPSDAFTCTAHDAIALHRVLEPWNEGTGDGNLGEASWFSRMTGVAWTNAGATAPGSCEAVAQAQIAANASGSVDIALPAALVQSWVTTPANHGVTFATTSADDCELVASEGSLGNRPLLIVTYFP